MAGRFRALTCAQEPRCSRHDNPALAACPQGSLSSAMAVPHNDNRRRKAAASLVLALLAASNALMDTAAALSAVGAAAAGVDGDANAGIGTAVADVGWGATCGLSPPACKGEDWRCHNCQPPKAATAMPTIPKAQATHPSHTGTNR